RPVATIPTLGAGVARTRSESWQLSVERHRLSWRIVARSEATDQAIATAAPSVIQNSYILRLAGTVRRQARSFRLRRAWIRGGWRLAERRKQFVSIRRSGTDGYEMRVGPPSPPAHIPVPLICLLALYAVIAESAVARTPNDLPLHALNI